MIAFEQRKKNRDLQVHSELRYPKIYGRQSYFMLAYECTSKLYSLILFSTRSPAREQICSGGIQKTTAADTSRKVTYLIGTRTVPPVMRKARKLTSLVSARARARARTRVLAHLLALL